MDAICEFLSPMCLSAAALGRLWVALYNKGRRGCDLLTSGPYSLVRHPLYVCSFLASIGAGLATERLSLTALAILYFLSHFALMGACEEQMLLQRFGNDYRTYRASVSACWPSFSAYHEPARLEVHVGAWCRALRDAAALLLTFPALQALEAMQLKGWLPNLLQIP